MSANDIREILVLDGNSVQSLPFLESFTKSGYNVTIACPWKFSIGYMSKFPKKRVIFCNIYKNKDAYYSLLLGYLQNNKCDFILALGDVTMKLLEDNYSELVKYAQMVIPGFQEYNIAADKLKTMQYCMKHNINCPATINPEVEDVDTFILEYGFPLILKPRVGVGSVGVLKVENRSHYDAVYTGHHQRHGPLLLQEYVQSDVVQYQAVCFCDGKASLKGCVVVTKNRYYPVKGGTGTCTMTINNEAITSMAEKLLKGIGWVGAADIDILYDLKDQQYKVVEINPRVPSNIKLAFRSGVDFAAMYIQSAVAGTFPEVRSYKENVILRNILTETLWYLHADSNLRKETSPPFFDFFSRDTYYVDFSKSDPFPFLGFLYGKLFRRFSAHY